MPRDRALPSALNGAPLSPVAAAATPDQPPEGAWPWGTPASRGWTAEYDLCPVFGQSPCPPVAVVHASLTANGEKRLARNCISSRKACNSAEVFPRHIVPRTTGAKSGSGTARTLGNSFALGTCTETPKPNPLAT